MNDAPLGPYENGQSAAKCEPPEMVYLPGRQDFASEWLECFHDRKLWDETDVTYIRVDVAEARVETLRARRRGWRRERHELKLRIAELEAEIEQLVDGGEIGTTRGTQQGDDDA